MDGGSGGQKLGGAPVLRGTDIRKVIADAAQRRITVTKGCASGTDQGRKIQRDVEHNRNGFRTKAAEDDANERAIMQAYIELIQEDEKEKYGDHYVPPSENNPAGPRAAMSHPATAATLTDDVMSAVDPSHPAPQEERRNPSIDLLIDEDLNTWTCPVCTLINPNQFLICDACTVERPALEKKSSPPPSKTKPRRPEAQQKHDALKPRQSVAKSLASLEAQEAGKPAKPMGWLCHVCSNWMESQWWTCARCGTLKQAS